VIDCITTEPGVQVYTSNGMNGSVVRSSGTVYRQTDAFTLETQHSPTAPISRFSDHGVEACAGFPFDDDIALLDRYALAATAALRGCSVDARQTRLNTIVELTRWERFWQPLTSSMQLNSAKSNRRRRSGSSLAAISCPPGNWRYAASDSIRPPSSGRIEQPFCEETVGKPDFSAIEFTINGSKFPIGDFINAVVSFILIAAAVYFFIVLPMNTLLARMRRGEAGPDPTTKKCPECLSDVPIAARRCAFCTSPLTEATTR
jgi:large conductance mechanosensitive channel